MKKLSYHQGIKLGLARENLSYLASYAADDLYNFRIGFKTNLTFITELQEFFKSLVSDVGNITSLEFVLNKELDPTTIVIINNSLKAVYNRDYELLTETIPETKRLARRLGKIINSKKRNIPEKEILELEHLCNEISSQAYPFFLDPYMPNSLVA